MNPFLTSLGADPDLAAALVACAGGVSGFPPPEAEAPEGEGTPAAPRPSARLASQRVAVIDPCEGGHHFPWMVDFCRAHLRAGVAVTALLPEAERLERELLEREPEHAHRLAAVSSEGLLKPADHLGSLPRLIETARNWTRLQAALDALPRSLRPDAVFFPYVDPLLCRGLAPVLLERLFTYRWSALYMKPIWLRTGRRIWPRLQSSVSWGLAARNCEAVAVIDEGVREALAELLPDKPVLDLPDFLPSNSEVVSPGIHPEVARRAAGRCVVGVVGSLQSRKGIGTLLRLALDHPEAPYFFVFAGKFMPNGFTAEELDQWKRVFRESPENCYIRPTAVESEEEYVALANSCDISYAAYHQFPNSSNALVWAAWLQKPVVVSDGFLMAERVRAHRLGEVVPEKDPAATWEALEALRRRLADGQNDFGFSSYLATHSRDRLDRRVEQLTGTLSL